MKRGMVAVIALILIIGIATGVMAAGQGSLVGRAVQGTYPVVLNGNTLGQTAIVIDGTSYLPVRAVADALNLKVEFENNTITLTGAAFSTADNGGGPNGRGGMTGDPMEEIASILGMTSSELQADLKAGTTLEEIASGRGMTLAQLKEELIARQTEEIEKMVSEGKMTSAQGQEMITRMQGMDLSSMGAGPPGGPQQPPSSANQ